MDKFVTSIKQNTTKNQDENIKNEQKIHKKNQKIMKLYNKKIIMKINFIQLIFTVRSQIAAQIQKEQEISPISLIQ